jgi:hypothetical protein
MDWDWDSGEKIRTKASPAGWRQQNFCCSFGHPFARSVLLVRSIVRFCARDIRFLDFIFAFSRFCFVLRGADIQTTLARKEKKRHDKYSLYRFNSGALDMRSVTWP